MGQPFFFFLRQNVPPLPYLSTGNIKRLHYRERTSVVDKRPVELTTRRLKLFDPFVKVGCRVIVRPCRRDRGTRSSVTFQSDVFGCQIELLSSLINDNLGEVKDTSSPKLGLGKPRIFGPTITRNSNQHNRVNLFSLDTSDLRLKSSDLKEGVYLLF